MLDKYQCDVGDKQHSEIMQLVSSVNHSEAVQELIRLHPRRGKCFTPSLAAGCYRTPRIRQRSNQSLVLCTYFYACTCTCVCVCMYVCMFVCLYVCVCMCVCTFVGSCLAISFYRQFAGYRKGVDHHEVGQ